MITRKKNQEKGQSLTEYTAILSLAALVLMASFGAITVQISSILRLPGGAPVPLPIVDGHKARGDSESSSVG